MTGGKGMTVGVGGQGCVVLEESQYIQVDDIPNSFARSFHSFVVPLGSSVREYYQKESIFGLLGTKNTS